MPCPVPPLRGLNRATVGNLDVALEVVANLTPASGNSSIASDDLTASVDREGVRSSRSSAGSLLAGGADGVAILSSGYRQAPPRWMCSSPCQGGFQVEARLLLWGRMPLAAQSLSLNLALLLATTTAYGTCKPVCTPATVLGSVTIHAALGCCHHVHDHLRSRLRCLSCARL